MGLKEKTLEHFHNKFTCAQALLMAYGPECGLSEEMAGNLGKAFVGGMGFMGGTCGVATAAFMILGLHYDLQTTNAHANLFVENFTGKNKTLLCNDLLGCDISTAEGRQFIKDHDLRGTLCAKFLADGCDILDAILSLKTRQTV
jgi:C_GCAxxG_C_C family probable redox protein